MFGKLKEHARKMESSAMTLEKSLEARLRPLMSTARRSVSAPSLQYVNELLEELRAIDANVRKAVADLRELNEDRAERLRSTAERVRDIENHLRDSTL